jgi:hypothetical protein
VREKNYPGGRSGRPPLNSAELPVANEPLYLNLRQLAGKTGLSIHSLRHWIYDGRLTHDQGLRVANGRWLVEWAVFKAALDAGQF